MYRGADCVSLGWCFWHRGCYGCVFCGDRRLVRGVGVSDLFEEDDDGSEGEDQYTRGRAAEDGEDGIESRGRAREVDEVPLCAHCAVDLEKKGAGGDDVVQMALTAAETRDGGLAMMRWTARQEASGRRTVRPESPASEISTLNASETTPRRTPAGSIWERSRRFEGDGTSGESPDDLFGWSPCPVPLDSAIYVSASDPFGRAAFKPSPTKPIPKWMAMLPSHRPDLMAWDKRPASILDDHFARPASKKTTRLGTRPAKRVTFCPSPRKAGTKKRPGRYEHPAEPWRPKEPAATSTPVGSSPATQSVCSRSIVSAEPLLRPSSRRQLRQTDTTGSSAYETPPETPDLIPTTRVVPLSPPPLLEKPSTREKRPVKPGLPQLPPRSESSVQPPPVRAVATVRRLSKPPSLPRLPIPEFEKTAPVRAARRDVNAERGQARPRPDFASTPGRASSHLTPAQPRHLAPARSSEFLDRYAAGKNTRGVVVPSSLTARPAGGQAPEAPRAANTPFAGNMRRNSKGLLSAGVVSLETARASPSQGDVGTKGYGGGSGLGKEGRGGGPGDGTVELRRRSLADELRRLFGEW